ncbi:hypothetical protein ACFV3F_25940 [Streptomyces sp. NPDC059717]|uniref:hypothetical protein n=1 Tax=Streptomyces sp. NPDC059717 TaxID=3346922 RepID=UPI00369A83F9
MPHNPAQTTPTPSNSNKAAGPGALADLGFLGLDRDCNDQVVVTGYKATRARNLTTDRRPPTGSSPPAAPPSSTASRT